MDVQPVFTPLHHGLVLKGSNLDSLTKSTRRLGAWKLAASGVRLVSDFRGAPGMGARAAGRAMNRLSRALCVSNRTRVHLDSALPSGPCILVANHQSYLDPVIIASLVPCLPIARAEVAEWPVVGELSRRYGALFVKLGSSGSSYRVMRGALANLQEGGTILNFPEGTTSNGRVGRFRKGIFGLAAIAQVPVVPVAIAMNESLVRKDEQSAVGHYLTVVKEGPHDVFVRFGKPLPTGPDATLLARLARARIQLMLEELRASNGLSGVRTPTSWELSARGWQLG